MKIAITGICGFVGSILAHGLLEQNPAWEILGLDNFSRAGSEQNRDGLRAKGVRLFHGDVRASSDFEALPRVDWVIDAAANPSVLAGVDGKSSARQLVEHNLSGTLNLLEYCRQHAAGLVLLSTSRVYSIRALAGLPVETKDEAFRLRAAGELPLGVSESGLDERFSTAAPVSLYGATKLASEQMALEYGEAFRFPVWINRCGVMAGAGQFGRADQGIVAYWINSYLRRAPLRYIGFGGRGYQVRDALHPLDLLEVILQQIAAGQSAAGQARLINLSGGIENTFSLAQLTRWCADRFGFEHPIESRLEERPFDIPWMVMDCARAQAVWGWRPRRTMADILTEVASHAERHPHWLQASASFS